MDRDEIDELIREASGRQLEILIRLKTLNQQASFWQKGMGKTYKKKYNEMWRELFWKEGRKLLKEYFSKDGISKCPICNRIINDRYVLHHDFYPKKASNLLTPLYCQIICVGCNMKVHKDKP